MKTRLYIIKSKFIRNKLLYEKGDKMKIAFLFPGQGSQSVGMGKDIYEKYEEVRNVYNTVKDITSIDVAKISFEGEEEILNQTKYTQLCILTMSLAILELLKKENFVERFIKGKRSCRKDEATSR